MPKLGECVETTEKEIEALDTKWNITIEVYHPVNGSRYNLLGFIEQADTGLFETPDSWMARKYNVYEEELDPTIERMTKKLLKTAEKRIEARNLDITIGDISID